MGAAGSPACTEERESPSPNKPSREVNLVKEKGVPSGNRLLPVPLPPLHHPRPRSELSRLGSLSCSAARRATTPWGRDKGPSLARHKAAASPGERLPPRGPLPCPACPALPSSAKPAVAGRFPWRAEPQQALRRGVSHPSEETQHPALCPVHPGRCRRVPGEPARRTRWGAPAGGEKRDFASRRAGAAA